MLLDCDLSALKFETDVETDRVWSDSVNYFSAFDYCSELKSINSKEIALVKWNEEHWEYL